jgi:hypothetical protein
MLQIDEERIKIENMCGSGMHNQQRSEIFRIAK